MTPRLETYEGWLRERRLVADHKVRFFSFTDAYMAIQIERAGREEIYSYDQDFDRLEQVTRIEP